MTIPPRARLSARSGSSEAPEAPDKNTYKLCKYCDKPFEPNRDWQLFCRPKCSSGWHNDKKILHQIALEAKLKKLMKELKK